MPTIKSETKPAVLVLAKKDGKKQYYTSGSKAGKPKYKIKTPAKYAAELDVKAISSLIDNESIVVIETPGISRGNAARSTATTNMNYGKILAILELNNCEIIKVSPAKWKKDLKLSKEKIDSILLAEQLSPLSTFRTKRNALLDGQAEAFLIRHWYIATQLKE